MVDKKDKKPRKKLIKVEKEPKPVLIQTAVEPGPAFVSRSHLKGLAREPSKQADYKPDYLKEAQFAHQIHLKTIPDPKPSPADLVTKGLQYAGDVVNRLGKSAAKIEQVVENAPKRKPGRPKKQSTKDKEDEKLAMEVKGTKDAVSAVAKELERHEEMSEAEHEGPRLVIKEKSKRKSRFPPGSAEAKAWGAAMKAARAAKKKKEEK